MAEKVSTLVLKVDLDCERCYKKIRKVLCKLQDKSNIKAISFDEKYNTVTISGPFDPEALSEKLSREAGKVITEMHLDIKGKEKDSNTKHKDVVKKPEIKKQVKFELDNDDKKPAVAMAVSKLEAPLGEPSTAVQAVAVPSIWPAYEAPHAVGGYYGVAPVVLYRSPYPMQYYCCEEEPSAGCSIV